MKLFRMQILQSAEKEQVALCKMIVYFISINFTHFNRVLQMSK